MRMLVSVFLAVVGVFMVGRATAQQTRGVPVPIGFMKSEGFLGLDPREQSMYAIGLFDGSMLAPLVQSGALGQAQLDRCTNGMTAIQLAAMIEKEVKEHPEFWNSGTNAALYRALVKGCPK